jgi:hypothetical protein
VGTDQLGDVRAEIDDSFLKQLSDVVEGARGVHVDEDGWRAFGSATRRYVE